MQLILISGLGADRSGNGLLDIAAKSGLAFTYYEHDADIKIPPMEELAFVGHSLGAERCLQLIQSIYPRKVKYFATIDFVTSRWWPFFFWEAGKFVTIPTSVERADCFQRKGGFIPPSSRCLNPSNFYRNYFVSMSHGNAPRNIEVQNQILKSLGEIKI